MDALSPQAAHMPMRTGEEGRLSTLLASLGGYDAERLRLLWRNHLGGSAPSHLPAWLLMRVLAYRLQAQVFGDLDRSVRRALRAAATGGPAPFSLRPASTRDGLDLKPGSLLTREWQGRLERVMILDDGFAWNGKTYGSLSQTAKAITGTNWNGHRFFGLKPAREKGARGRSAGKAQAARPRARGSLRPRRSLRSESAAADLDDRS